MADEDAVFGQLLVDRDLLLFNCLQLHQGEPHPFHFVLQWFDLGLDSSLCSQRIILEVTFLVCKLMDLLGSLLNQSIHVLHRVVLVFILWFLGVTRPTRDVTSCWLSTCVAPGSSAYVLCIQPLKVFSCWGILCHRLLRATAELWRLFETHWPTFSITITDGFELETSGVQVSTACLAHSWLCQGLFVWAGAAAARRSSTHADRLIKWLAFSKEVIFRIWALSAILSCVFPVFDFLQFSGHTEPNFVVDLLLVECFPELLELHEGFSHFEYEFTYGTDWVVVIDAESSENWKMSREFPWVLLQLDWVVDQAHHEVLVLL